MQGAHCSMVKFFGAQKSKNTMDQYGNVVPVPRVVPNLGFRGGIEPLVDLERFDNSRWYHASQLYDSDATLPRAFGSEVATSAQVPSLVADAAHPHIDARTPNLSYGGIAPKQD